MCPPRLRLPSPGPVEGASIAVVQENSHLDSSHWLSIRARAPEMGKPQAHYTRSHANHSPPISHESERLCSLLVEWPRQAVFAWSAEYHSKSGPADIGRSKGPENRQKRRAPMRAYTASNMLPKPLACYLSHLGPSNGLKSAYSIGTIWLGCGPFLAYP